MLDINKVEKRVKIRKIIRGNRRKLSSKYKNLKNEQLLKIRLVKHIVNDLKNHGPTNLIHVNALSTITGKSIRVWKSRSRLYRTITDRQNENSIHKPVDIEYHKQPSNYIGHWTLLGNKDPTNVAFDLNSCLFAVIAAQIGKNPNDLRACTIDFLTKNPKYLIDQINKLISYKNNDNGTSLMIGGAQYIGTSHVDAAGILDNSQDVLCHTCRQYGHPRGHASNTNARGPNDSVENYSRTTHSRKSGFLSRHDQNIVAHLALTHRKAQQAMDELNDGSMSETVTLTRQDLQNNTDMLPQMKEYYNGEAYSGNLDIIRITVVLRHHLNKHRDLDADVFVHTLYPRSS